MSAHVARRWGHTGPGEMSLLGYRVPYPNQSHAFFLLHELFVNLSYAFDPPSPAPRIVDCGANIGMSVVFFKAWSPDASIVAIEPDATAFDYLRELVRLNELKNVELMNAAIARQRGTAAFYSASGDPAGVRASLHADWGGSTSTTVKTIALSDVIDHAVDFLKLDVEGAEYEAIDDLDGRNRLKWIRELVVECHELHGDSAPRQRLVDQLERAGLHMSVVYQEERIAVLHATRISDSV